MTGSEEEFACRRILVALDASAPSLAALEAAAQLAAELGAELLGLFVEDVNLLRLARLPFARQVHYLSATGELLDSIKMERQLRVQAEQARRALAETAERTHVRWSFRVARGQVALEVLAAALESDLLTLGNASRPLTRRVRIGSTALAVAAGASGAVLLVQSGTVLARPIVLLYDGAAGAARALNAAARLGASSEIALLVFLLAEDAAEGSRLREEAGALLAGRGIQVRYRRLAPARLAELAAEVRAEGGGLLVLDAHSPLLQGKAMQKVLQEITIPVLLVR